MLLVSKIYVFIITIDSSVLSFFQTSYKFIGNKTRTKEQLQSLMYSDEMETWLAEERHAEAQTQARLMAALIRDDGNGQNAVIRANGDGVPGASNVGVGEIVQVVDDEDEVTTIRRPILPDLMA